MAVFSACTAFPALAQTATVSVNLKTLLNFSAETATAQVCFTLKYTKSFAFPSPPRIVGSGVIARVNTQCHSTDGSGVVTVALPGNDQIKVGGQVGVTYYRVEYYLDAQMVSGANYTINTTDSPVDLCQKVPLSVPPFIAAPIGDDGPYARLNRGNRHFTRTTTAGGHNNVLYPSGFTIAAIQIAANTVGAFANGGKVMVPTGTYTGSGVTLSLPPNVTIECDGWDAILQWTGSTTPAISAAANTVLRNCKVDTSGGTIANILTTTGNSGLLDNNYFLGAATDSQTTHGIIISNSTWMSRNNTFDTIAAFTVRGTQFRGVNDRFLNYRTGYYLPSAHNSIIESPQCLSIAGSGVERGFDCVLSEQINYLEIHNPVIKASREHGIYFGGNAVGNAPSTDLKVIGGTITGFAGVGVKAAGPNATGHSAVLIDHVTVDGCTATRTCEGVSVQACNNCEVAGGTMRNLAFGIDILGPVDTVNIHDAGAELNQADGIRLRDLNGALLRVRVHDNRLLNNSQTRDGYFSGIELVPQGGFANSAISIYNNRIDSTLGLPRQSWGVQLDLVANGSTINGLELIGNRASGTAKNVNNSGAVQGIPARGYSNVLVASSFAETGIW